MNWGPQGRDGFLAHKLDEAHQIWEGRLPAELCCDEAAFQAMWELHPAEFHDVRMGGRWVKTPRWQQAYHRDYAYTGSRNNAQPVPEVLQPFWDWTRLAIDSRLNGLLVNWYDGSQGHYIGRHRDTPNQLIPGSPIVTISLGEARKFRMRPWRGQGYLDFDVRDGTVIVMPFATNQAWTHEVPKFRSVTGRRISVTVRAFAD